ncbi:hypothetical protein ACFSCX_18400 [Bacillus salitolerans]|uniref:Phage tail protein n=1 Tax=Bacillus salitolerans TaxID=1437434 RepID=A0ABW4LTT5_9BACI
MSAIRNYQYFGGQPVKWGEYEPIFYTAQSNTNREFPEVDVTLFNESANAFKRLMRDASIVLDALAGSKHFDFELMSAAQVSDKKKVDQLIQSTGIKSKVDTTYNPDGITLNFQESVKNTECCKLTMKLRWR